MTFPFTRSPHLVGLIAEVERLATRVRTADAPQRARQRPERVLSASRASLLLDGARAAAAMDPERAREIVAHLVGPDAADADAATTAGEPL
ncbi:MAG: hypothetical protein ACLFS9_08110, partial [Nitriliruptoraceae bacterium]